MTLLGESNFACSTDIWTRCDGRYGSARASSIVPNVDVINIPVLPTVEKTKDVAQSEEKKAQNNA